MTPARTLLEQLILAAPVSGPGSDSVVPWSWALPALQRLATVEAFAVERRFMIPRFRERVEPGTVGAYVVKVADNSKLRMASDIELYNIVVDEACDQTTRELAALLYVEQKELGALSARLNEIGELIELRSTEQLMRCADGHLWIRDIGKERTKCPTCQR